MVSITNNLNNKFMRTTLNLLFLALIALLAASCEKAVFDDVEDGEAEKAKGNVTFRVTCFEQLYFGEESSDLTRATVPITDLCSRIDLVVFNGSEKVESVTQKYGDEDFGNVSMTLTEGTYQVVAVGHNGTGKATISSADKITFADNKVTDTFSYYGELTVGEEAQTVDLVLNRVVAMFRLNITGAIPDNASYLEFYYTGGSSTLGAESGCGVVESRQTEIREIVEGQTKYEVYTIPRKDSNSLVMRIRAFDAADQQIREANIPSVPITVNRITQCSGDFFSGSAVSSLQGFGMTANGDWAGTDAYDFTYE